MRPGPKARSGSPAAVPCASATSPPTGYLEFSEETGELTVFSDGVEFTNGRTLDLEGNVVECSHGRRAVQRDTAVGPGDQHRPTTVVDRFAEHRLNSPNDGRRVRRRDLVHRPLLRDQAP